MSFEPKTSYNLDVERDNVFEVRTGSPMSAKKTHVLMLYVKAYCLTSLYE
jgi:hypothetical protein